MDDTVEDHGGYVMGNPFALKAIAGAVKTARELRAEKRAQRQAAVERGEDPAPIETGVIRAEDRDANTIMDTNTIVDSNPVEDAKDEGVVRPADPTPNRTYVIRAEDMDAEDIFFDDEQEQEQGQGPPVPIIPPTEEMYHQYFTSTAPLPNPFAHASLPSPNPFASRLAAIPGGRPWSPSRNAQTAGAVSRYLELLTAQPPLIPHPSPEDPSSPSSSEIYIGPINHDGYILRSPLGDGAGIGRAENGEVEVETREGTGETGSGSWAVHGEAKAIEMFLGAPLRKTARVLHFMVKAKAGGIDVGGFDSGFDPETFGRERWEGLVVVDTPDDAAQIVLAELLKLSVVDFIRLYEKATILRNDLFEMGIVID
ncbi:hypothetical protein F5Y09DRAFT_317581 [Xylaria sp. FL1042]|nr:hypothetical protein F5Y09DRAFT_317581 [Xylaria sp. FL1042]